jgi:hypothetical protein
MARIVEQVTAWMVVDEREKTFKGHSVMQVFRRVQLETKINDD